MTMVHYGLKDIMIFEIIRSIKRTSILMEDFMIQQQQMERDEDPHNVILMDDLDDLAEASLVQLRQIFG